MSCPTCNHTMQKIGDWTAATDAEFQLFWCPRCGTLLNQFGAGEKAVPELVERCRSARERWRRMGIAESIRTPERRPT